MEILKPNEIPSWLEYPPEYLRLLEQNIVTFAPWYILETKLARLRFAGLQERYPNRRLFAFAARLDNDDIACWEDGKPGQVLVIHDFAPNGFADANQFPSFWDWFRAAIEDMIAHDD